MISNCTRNLPICELGKFVPSSWIEEFDNLGLTYTVCKQLVTFQTDIIFFDCTVFDMHKVFTISKLHRLKHLLWYWNQMLVY